MDLSHFTTDTFQLRRVDFVPAQRQDAAPVPKGVDIIVLNGTLPVRPQHRQEHLHILTLQVLLTVCGSCEQDSDGPAAASVPTTPKMHQKELFREQDVTLRWKTVQKTVRNFTKHCLHFVLL